MPVAKSVVRSGNESRRNYVHARNYYFYRNRIFFSVNEYAHYAEHASMKMCREKSYTHVYTAIERDDEGRKEKENDTVSIQT